MRAAFYALLLVNVAFFGWAHWIDTPDAPAAAAPARALPTLALVPSGRPADSTAGAGASATAPAAAGRAVTSAAPTAAAAARSAAAAAKSGGGASAASSVRCRSLGPFTNSALAVQMAGRLQARGLSPVDRKVDISINDGYSVYLSEPAGDTGAERRMLASLTRAGVQDVHAVTDPQQGSRISLGMFADQARAVKRAEQIRQLGFKPVLDIHQSAVTTHWLDLQLEPNEPTPPLSQLLQEIPGGAAAVSPMVAFSDCPTSTAGG